MLTPAQEGYLATVREERIAHIHPFDPETQMTAQEIIGEVKSDHPNTEIYYIGSSKLGIAGENDIDLSIFVGKDFEDCLSRLARRYGEPTHRSRKSNYVNWEFIRNGFPIELHLGDFVDAGFKEQLATQKILENDGKLRKEYEKLKLQCDGLPWKEYLIKKYEFWNRILGLK
ncbi:MAG: GrpB family protein [Candidatus Berkelbacteria bacterium]|nr:GrpB family protein [Candidatus Berkelbacteria bacterium]MCR4307522.1 GrpB family protein [Candidatus Berkelbacteria bacterium]